MGRSPRPTVPAGAPRVSSSPAAEPESQSEPEVQSVGRTLHILELLGNSPSPLGVVAIAETAGLAQATTHRLLQTLRRRGWVRQGIDRRYALGVAMLRFGETAQRHVAATARPFLDQIVVLTAETANLAVLEGDHVSYVGQAPSPHRLRTFAEVGHRVPVHSTAVGKALIAHLPEEVVADLVARAGLPARTPLTITDSERLRDELDSVRQLGYAVDDGEEAEGVYCVAVPVRDSNGNVVCALSVSAPASRVTARDAPSLTEKLELVARRFAESLG